MDHLKLFGKDNTDLKRLIYTVKCISDGIGIDFEQKKICKNNIQDRENTGKVSTSRFCHKDLGTGTRSRV